MSQARVLIWPADNVGQDPADATELRIKSGSVALNWDELSRSFSFIRPHDLTYLPDEYNPAIAYLTTGAWLEVQTSVDGSFADLKKWFYGRIKSHGAPRGFQEDVHDALEAEYRCLDPLAIARNQSVNISWATRVKIYETTFDSSDFNGADPDFLVDIPDNSEDWMPDGLISLTAFDNTGGDEDDGNLVDYGRDEYVYSPGLKQLYFVSSQAEPIKDKPKANFTWTIRLYYYDPTDTEHTVKKLLEKVFRGEALSEEGGLSFLGADLDFEEIVSFDGVSPKKVRSFTWDKTRGPVSSLLDELRQSGLLPVNYRIFFDPATRKVIGRYEFQDNPSVKTLGGVMKDVPGFELEGIPIRAECHAPAITPVNLALEAAVTTNLPSGYSTVPAADAKDNVNDGDPGSFMQVQKDVNTLDYDVVATGSDFLVLDLGSSKYISEVHIRGSSPKEEKGSDFQEIPVYHESRMAKVTVSASDDILTDDVGVPVNAEAIAALMPGREIDDYADHQWEASLKTQARYILVRFEQDYFFRRDGNNIGSTARQSTFNISEIRVLGDPRYRYPAGHTDAEGVPYAQLTDKGTTVASILAADQFTVADASWMNDGDEIQLEISGTPASFTIATVVGTTVTLTSDATGLMVNDQVGWRKRWMQALAGDWIDLYAPKLVARLTACHYLLEVIDDQQPSSLEEAEQFCVEKLLEKCRFGLDHEVEILLEHNIDIGDTVRCYKQHPSWLVSQLQLNINQFTENPHDVPVTIQLSGKDRENDWQ